MTGRDETRGLEPLLEGEGCSRRQLLQGLGVIAAALFTTSCAGEYEPLVTGKGKSEGVMLRELSRAGIPITGEAFRYAAGVIHAEAGGEPREGKYAVAWVMANRWLHDNYWEERGAGRRFSTRERQDLGAIIQKPGDFARPRRLSKNREREGERILYEVLREAVVTTRKDPTRGALYFLQPTLHLRTLRFWEWPRRWRDVGRSYARMTRKIGSHVFYTRAGDEGAWRSPPRLPPRRER